jgi:hypothetical protein
MLVFLTCLRHPQNSNNFARVESLFEMSLKSVCAQTDPNFRVIVVANVKPRIGFEDPRVIYHLVDFPPPSPDRHAAINIKAVTRDKGTKLIAGMLVARSFEPSYFGIFDADDVICRRLAGFVNETPSLAGWYVDAGYAINHRTWRVQRKSGLVRYCGSTLIPNAAAFLKLGQLDSRLPDDATQDEILRRVSHSVIDEVVGDHRYFVRYFADHGLRMRRVPFRAVGWMLETGENYSFIRSSLSGVPITDEFCREFGICNPPLSQGHSTAIDQLRESVGAAFSMAGSFRQRLVGFPRPS